MVVIGDRLFVALVKRTRAASKAELAGCRDLQRSSSPQRTLFELARRCGILTPAAAQRLVRLAGQVVLNHPEYAADLILEPDAGVSSVEGAVEVAAEWVPDDQGADPSGATAADSGEPGLLPEEAAPRRAGPRTELLTSETGPLPKLLPDDDEDLAPPPRPGSEGALSWLLGDGERAAPAPDTIAARQTVRAVEQPASPRPAPEAVSLAEAATWSPSRRFRRRGWMVSSSTHGAL